MSVFERTGLNGKYYGSKVGYSSPCNQSQMEVNALYIYTYLSSRNWTKNSIAALLGNMQAESSINPGRWENDEVNVIERGFGLVQWTPSTKFTNWANGRGWDDATEMDINLMRIIYELENSLQWIETSSYPLSFEEFAHSRETPSYLAGAFVINYERPGDQSDSVIVYRGELANAWYEFLGGTIPTPANKKKKKKFNFILYNKRRGIYGQRKIY